MRTKTIKPTEEKVSRRDGGYYRLKAKFAELEKEKWEKVRAYNMVKDELSEAKRSLAGYKGFTKRQELQINALKAKNYDFEEKMIDLEAKVYTQTATIALLIIFIISAGVSFWIWVK